MKSLNQNTVLIASIVGLTSLLSNAAFAQEETQSSRDTPTIRDTHLMPRSLRDRVLQVVQQEQM